MRETIRDATRETRRSRRIAALPRLRNGRSPQRRHRGSLTKCTPREQCRRRPQGRNGCEEDDRSSNPRFRSAPTDRQASVGCETYLQNRCRLSPTRPTGCRRAVPDRASPPPDLEPGRHHRQSARCSKTTSPSPISLYSPSVVPASIWLVTRSSNSVANAIAVWCTCYVASWDAQVVPPQVLIFNAANLTTALPEGVVIVDAAYRQIRLGEFRYIG